jgi:hypothetical protein
MLVRKTKLVEKYEAPRLKTYGTLQELTKGTQLSGTDNGTFKDGT